MNGDDLGEKINQALEKYNLFRSPESVAKLIKLEEDKIVVEFSGNFCKTCGACDWVEDFKYALEDFDVETDLVEYIEPENDDARRIGVFRLKKPR